MTESTALVDVGGSSIKVSIYTAEYDEIVTASEPALPISVGDSVSQDSAWLLERILRVMKRAGKQLPVGTRINKVLISTIRQGFCLITDDCVSTPIIYNSDTSGRHCEQEVLGYGHDRLYNETGHWFAAQLTLPKLVHLKKSHPELFLSNTKIAFVHDWLVWELSGVLRTEMTLVSSGQLALLSESKVHSGLLEYFGFNPDLIPPVGVFNDVVGGLKPSILEQLGPEWHEVNVHIGGGDSHFLHLGGSHNDPRTIVVSAGSSTPISYLKDDLKTSELASPWKSTSFVENLYFHEGNCGYPGTYFGWLQEQKTEKEHFGTFTFSRDDVDRSPKVFGSCQHWSYLSWRNCPPFSILNLTASINLNEVTLGLILDYAFALKSQILDLTNGEMSSELNVVITGGGASELLGRVLQTILGRPVHVMSAEECAKNALHFIATGNLRTGESGPSVGSFDKEVLDSLSRLEKSHAGDYRALEGTKELIRNVA